MKKLLFIGALVLMTAAAFAQAPATNYEIYGSTFFDYQASGTGTSMATPLLSNFIFSKVRIGLRAQLADGVKSYFEFDPRNAEFRHTYIDWTAAPGLTITLGKTYTNFEQIIAYYGGGRAFVAGAKYAMPGLGWIGLQVGNKSDEAFLSGNYLSFPTLSGTNTTGVAVAQDPWLYLWPAIALKPDLGTDISLEVGFEGQLRPQLMGAVTPTGADIDAYIIVGGMGLTLKTEFAWIAVNNATAANQQMSCFAQLTYNAGIVAPTVYLVTDAPKGDFTVNPNTAIGFELPIQVTKDFKINPLFSYAISSYNAFEGSWAISKNVYNKNDWTLGIRFDYSYSIKF